MPSSLVRVLCLATALAAVQVSAARHLTTRSGAVVMETTRGSARRLSCNSGCSNFLGTATNFGVLAATTVTNDGPTYVQGDVGVSPGTEMTGFPFGRASGTLHGNSSDTTAAQSDAHIGFALLESFTFTTELSGADLGGMTLAPGVFYFSEGAHLNSNLTLDAGGKASAVFVFQTVSTFVTAANSKVLLINGAQACNVYYQVGSSATLGTASTLEGNVVAYASIGLQHNAFVTGSLIAITAAVTMDTNMVTASGDCSTSA